MLQNSMGVAERIFHLAFPDQIRRACFFSGRNGRRAHCAVSQLHVERKADQIFGRQSAEGSSSTQELDCVKEEGGLSKVRRGGSQKSLIPAPCDVCLSSPILWVAKRAAVPQFRGCWHLGHGAPPQTPRRANAFAVKWTRHRAYRARAERMLSPWEAERRDFLLMGLALDG
jgi:hypothetical protein